MIPAYEDRWLTVYGGDARAVMAEMEPASIDCVVTSPPYYGLRDYGLPPSEWGDGWSGCLGLEPEPERYVDHLAEVMRSVRRVLRPRGTLWLNLGDSYWGNGGTGGALGATSQVRQSPKYQTERRPEVDNPRALGKWNRRTTLGLKEKDLIGMPWRVALALQADGWWLRSDVVWSKPNPMPDSTEDRPTKAHEYVFLLTPSEHYDYDHVAVREQGSTGGRNLRSVWHVATRPYPGAHFAVMPTKIAEPCVKAGCPEGGVVLDPFAGTGTVGLVAQSLGRRAVLIDLNPDYLRQCLSRTSREWGVGGRVLEDDGEGAVPEGSLWAE